MTFSPALSHRVEAIKTSPTLAVSAKANKLQAAGHNIINLGVGEPDFDTPDFIKMAATQAIDQGFTKYTAVDGTPALKTAVAKKFSKENNLHYELNQILVSCGCKQSFFNLAQALLDPGDEVIIPSPYWVSYPDMVLLAEGKPVYVNTTYEQHFKLTPTQLEAAITPKTKLLVINSPSNPSGIAYSRTELAALAEVLLAHPQIMIASDDMYEHILWTKAPFSNILNACPDLYDRTVVLNGVSKAYAMTGWRIGYAAGPTKLIAAMTKIQSQSTSNPTSISQVAAQAALEGNQQCVRDMTKIFKQRHDVLYAGLQSLPGVKCLPSDGTFYSFPNVAEVIAAKGMQTDIEFAEYLLTEAGIAVVPGSAFGNPGCVRFSFATDLATLERAVAQFSAAIR